MRPHHVPSQSYKDFLPSFSQGHSSSSSSSSGGAYASILASVKSPEELGQAGPGEDKVDVVCDAVREAVEQLPGGRDKYLIVVATAYARSETHHPITLICKVGVPLSNSGSTITAT